MKKHTFRPQLKTFILAIAMLLLTFVATAQDRKYKFSTAVFTDTYAMHKDGFNIGASIDYQNTYWYYKAQLFLFPDLNGISYTELSGTPLGFNYHSKCNEYRVYTGLKLGFIFREGLHPLVGLESGLDINITETTFIGLMASYDYRTDGRVWEDTADNYMRLSGFVRLGFRF